MVGRPTTADPELLGDSDSRQVGPMDSASVVAVGMLAAEVPAVVRDRASHISVARASCSL